MPEESGFRTVFTNSKAACDEKSLQCAGGDYRHCGVFSTLLLITIFNIPDMNTFPEFFGGSAEAKASLAWTASYSLLYR